MGLWEKNHLTLVQEFSRIPVAIQLLVALANKPLCFRSSTNTPSPSPWQEGKRKILCEAPSVRETFSFFVLFGVCEESQKEKKERHDTLELFVGVLENPLILAGRGFVMSNLKGLANLTCLMRCHFQGFTHFKDPHHLPGKDSSLPLEVKGAINSKARARTVDPDSPGVPKGCRLPLSWSEMRRRFASTCSFTNLNKWLLTSKYKIQIINIYIYKCIQLYLRYYIRCIHTFVWGASIGTVYTRLYTPPIGAGKVCFFPRFIKDHYPAVRFDWGCCHWTMWPFMPFTALGRTDTGWVALSVRLHHIYLYNIYTHKYSYFIYIYTHMNTCE